MTLGGVLKITDEAVQRAQEILARADGEVLGLRVGVRQAGCSGMMYQVDYAGRRHRHDRVNHADVEMGN